MTILFGLVTTVIVYAVCKKIHQRWRLTLLSPMLTSFLVLALLLQTLHVPYSTYIAGGKYLTDFLQPATVALAVPLYRYRHVLFQHASVIVLSLLAGTVVAVTSSAGLAELLHLGRGLALSLAPRSVTTPVAMGISQTVGGNPVLTAVFVICTGITGIIIGPWLIRVLRIESAVGRGALMGMGAHGMGTTKAFEIGAKEGTVSSLSMVMAALAGVVLTPFILAHWI